MNTYAHRDNHTTDNRDKASKMADQALADLAAKLEAGQSDALKSYLTFLAKFYHYSALNTLLIQIQSPEATHVAGYGKWQELGRQVRKGEKGIAILAPVTYHRRDRNDQDRRETRLEHTAEEVPQLVVGFRTAYVFDVSQTDGKELPKFAEVTGDPGMQLGALKSLVKELGIGLAYSDSLGGARGISTGGRIVLLCGLRPAEEFSTLVHELAHELLHRGERRAETTVGIRELEAEATAFVVTTAIGLDNSTASSDYIQLYRGDARKLAESLSHIQRVSCEILDYLL